MKFKVRVNEHPGSISRFSNLCYRAVCRTAATLSVLTLFLAFAAGDIPEVQAAAGGTSFGLRVRAGVGKARYTIRPGWLPVMVQITNHGRHLRADAVAKNSTGTYTAKCSVNVPSGETKTYWLYVYVGEYQDEHGSYSSLDSDDEIRVTIESGGVVLARDKKPISVSSNTGGLDYSRNFLVLSDVSRKDVLQILQGVSIDRSGNNRLEITWPKQRSKDLPVELPDRAIGYDSIDLVIFNEYNFDKLSVEQRTALRTWVKSGGRIMFSPGSKTWLSGDFINSFVNIEGVEVFDNVSTLRNYRYHTFRQKFRLLAPKGKGLVNISSDRRMPLAKAVRVGYGRAYFLSFDLGKEPFWRWGGLQTYWQRELDEHTRMSRRTSFYEKPGQAGGNSDGRFNSDMCDRQMLDSSVDKLPSVALISFLIIFYLILVGPVNYFVLKRYDKQILIVVTVPALALLYLGVIFTAGYVTKGISNVMHKVTAVEMIEGESFAKVNTYFSLYSSSATRYEVSVDSHSTLYEMYHSKAKVKTGSLVVRQDHGFTAENYKLALWAIGYFRASSYRDAGGPVTFERDGDQVKIVNDTEYTVKGGILCEDGKFYMVEKDIPAKGQYYVNLVEPLPRLGDAIDKLFGEDEKLFGKKVSMYHSLEGSSRFIGLLKKDPTRIDIQGGYITERDAVLLIIRRKSSAGGGAR